MTRLVVGALALLLALAGCDGDPKAEPSTPPTSSSVSTTPSPSAPMLPSAAEANTKAGAIAFVKHYVEVQNFAARTGDTSTFRTLSLASCEECRSIVRRIERVYAHGGRIEGEGWLTRSAVGMSNAPGPTDLRYVIARLEIEPQVIVESPGASPSSFAGNDRLLMTFGLARSPEGWQLARMKVPDE
jgi:hypothetical protein